MKKIIREMELVVERTQTRVSMRSCTQRTAWCPTCRKDLLMSTPTAAARRAGESIRGIFRLIEAGVLHFTELSDGELLICSRSVVDHMRGVI